MNKQRSEKYNKPNRERNYHETNNGPSQRIDSQMFSTTVFWFFKTLCMAATLVLAPESCKFDKFHTFLCTL